MTSFPRGKRPKKAKDDADVAPKKAKDDLFGVQNKNVKKPKKKASKKTEKVDDANFVVAVAENLTYAKLESGMNLIGKVAEVTDVDLKVSLPGHLVGYVDINNISEA